MCPDLGLDLGAKRRGALWDLGGSRKRKHHYGICSPDFCNPGLIQIAPKRE